MTREWEMQETGIQFQVDPGRRRAYCSKRWIWNQWIPSLLYIGDFWISATLGCVKCKKEKINEKRERKKHPRSLHKESHCYFLQLGSFLAGPCSIRAGPAPVFFSCFCFYNALTSSQREYMCCITSPLLFFHTSLMISSYVPFGDYIQNAIYHIHSCACPHRVRFACACACACVSMERGRGGLTFFREARIFFNFWFWRISMLKKWRGVGRGPDIVETSFSAKPTDRGRFSGGFNVIRDALRSLRTRVLLRGVFFFGGGGCPKKKESYGRRVYDAESGREWGLCRGGQQPWLYQASK